MYLLLDRAVYSPGDTAHIQVMLTVGMHLPSVRELILTITSTEHTSFWGKKTTTNTERHMGDKEWAHCEQKSEIGRQKAVVAKFNNQNVGPGQYSFNCTYTFPVNTPCSVDYTYKSGWFSTSFAKLQHWMEGELILAVSPGGNYQPIKFKQEIRIISPPPSGIMHAKGNGNNPPAIYDKEFRVSKLFGEGGSLRLCCTFPCTVCTINTPIPVEIFIDATKSNASIDTVSVALVHRLVLKGDGDGELEEEKVLDRWEGSGCKRGNSNTVLGGIVVRGFGEKTIPYLPPTEGTLISSKYFVEVKAHVKAISLTQEPIMHRHEIKIADPTILPTPFQ